jgi:hypothetical protein
MPTKEEILEENEDLRSSLEAHSSGDCACTTYPECEEVQVELGNKINSLFLKAFSAGEAAERERIKEAVKKSALPGLNKAIVYTLITAVEIKP